MSNKQSDITSLAKVFRKVITKPNKAAKIVDTEKVYYNPKATPEADAINCTHLIKEKTVPLAEKKRDCNNKPGIVFTPASWYPGQDGNDLAETLAHEYVHSWTPSIPHNTQEFDKKIDILLNQFYESPEGLKWLNEHDDLSK